MKTTKLAITTLTALALTACGGEETKTVDLNDNPHVQTFSPEAVELINTSTKKSEPDADELDTGLELPKYIKPSNERVDLTNSTKIDDISIEVVRTFNYLMTNAIYDAEKTDGTFGNDSDRSNEHTVNRTCSLNGSVTTTYTAPTGLTFDDEIALGQGDSARVAHKQCAYNDEEQTFPRYYYGVSNFTVNNGAYNGYILVNNTDLDVSYEGYTATTELEVQYFIDGSINYLVNEGSIQFSAQDYTIYEYLEPNVAHFSIEEFNSSLSLNGNSWELQAEDTTVELSNINVMVDVSTNSPVILKPYSNAIESASFTVTSDAGELTITISDDTLVWSLDTDNDGQTDVTNTIYQHTYNLNI